MATNTSENNKERSEKEQKSTEKEIQLMLDLVKKIEQYFKENCIGIIYANDNDYKSIMENISSIKALGGDDQEKHENILKRIKEFPDKVGGHAQAKYESMNHWLKSIYKKITKKFKVPYSSKEKTICILNAIDSHTVQHNSQDDFKFDEILQRVFHISEDIENVTKALRSLRITDNKPNKRNAKISTDDELEKLKAENKSLQEETKELSKQKKQLDDLCIKIMNCNDDDQKNTLISEINNLTTAARVLFEISSECNRATKSNDNDKLKYLNSIINRVNTYNEDKKKTEDN